MDFSLTEEQGMMQDQMANAFERISPLSRVREIATTVGETPQDIWDEMCKLGIPGLLVDQDFGGLGLGILDAALIAEQLGRFIVPGPYIATAVMAPLALSLAGSSQQKVEFLPKLASGALIGAVGISEFASGSRMDGGVTLQNGRLSGSSIFVLDCASADILVVADREQRLHLVDARAAGLQRTILDTVDRTRAVCKMEFDNVSSEMLANESLPALIRMRDAARIVLAADTLGAAWSMLDKAVHYSGQRRQFGRLIGSFQAVKHICADMVAELEPGRSLMWYAAYAQDEGRADASVATAHAKAFLSEAGRMVARKAIEVHGGIGITDELGLHFWFKRIGWNYQMLGSPERLLNEAAQLQNLVA